MTKRALGFQIAAVTLVALVVVIFWALDPILTAIFMMTSSTTDAELIRQIWHFRLVQPEWVTGPGQLFKWQETEAYTRLSLVLLCWLAAVVSLVRRSSRGRPKPSNQSMKLTAVSSAINF